MPLLTKKSPGRRLRVSTVVTLHLSTAIDISDHDTVAQITSKAEANLIEQMRLMLDRKQFRVSGTDIEYQEFE